MDKLNENEFNKLMRSAVKKKEMHPDASIEAIATLTCLSYQGREDYRAIKNGVIYNLKKSNNRITAYS